MGREIEGREAKRQEESKKKGERKGEMMTGPRMG